MGFEAVVQHFFLNSKICMAKVVLIRKIIEAYFKFTSLFIGLVSSSSACLGQHFPHVTCLCFCNLKRHWQNIFTWTFAIGTDIDIPPLRVFWKSYFWKSYFGYHVFGNHIFGKHIFQFTEMNRQSTCDMIRDV